MKNVSHTVSGLLKKREELRRDLAQAEKTIRNIRVDLDHVEATLRVFEAGPRKLPRHDVSHRAKKGETIRHVLSYLREAKGPVTSEEITTAWCKARGLEADHDTYVTLRKRIGACLNTLKHKGAVEAVPGAGAFKGWQLNG